MLSTDGAAMPLQFLVLRIVVALTYGLVGTIGLLGNLAVLWVLGSCVQRVPGPPSDTFVFSLALANLVALTLPFWATESARDFHWPFGSALCKTVLTTTVLSIFASAFLIAALSIAILGGGHGCGTRESPLSLLGPCGHPGSVGGSCLGDCAHSNLWG